MLATPTSFVDRLKSHYHDISKFKRLYYRVQFSSKGEFQSYDFRFPDYFVNHYDIEIDLDRQQFYQHFKRRNPGNFVFENVSVINQNQAFIYDVNGFVHGKTLKPFNSDIHKEYNAMAEHIDLLAVYKLLFIGGQPITQTDIGNIVMLTTTNAEHAKKHYFFDQTSYRLLKIYDESTKRLLVFSEPVSYDSHVYASKIDTFNDGKLRNTINIQALHTISRIDRKKLAVPQGYAFSEHNSSSQPRFVKLAEHLFLIENVVPERNIMVLQHALGLTVFGAPLNEKASTAALSMIARELPKQTITHVYVSHAHSDHIGGLAKYVENGATVIADEYTIEAIKHYPEFKATIEKFNFKTIANDDTFQSVTYHVIENSHVRKQSFAYFAHDKIIYQGDFLEIPQDNVIATHMSDVERVFIAFLYRNNVDYTRIVGHHRNSNITPEVVDAYYKTNL